MNIVRNPMAAVAFVLITGWYLVSVATLVLVVLRMRQLSSIDRTLQRLEEGPGR